ncbi:MAG TPA: bifunctional hydroxymethylpyrimidine kinase/phosphomethylpyrimidine kinase [Acidisarcina sp.]|nr:bifunctional hydroxymethylpyrimidine kinase/phosphomethylpyrimidine kinase [Acidisarcina sp.]
MNQLPENQGILLPDAEKRHPPAGLTIAGFDPSSGAGITADLKVFAAHGVYGMAAITALTVQSSLGVRRCEPVEAVLLAETLECLCADVRFAGIKIGMLGSAAATRTVSSFLAESGCALAGRSRVVLDPVLRSTSGRALLESSGVSILRDQLLANLGWITPNLEEIEVLTGMRPEGREGTAASARRLQAMAAERGNPELNVVVTGGHLERPDDFLLTAAGEEIWFEGEHVATSATHGTGCAFSTALLCALMAGDGAVAAVRSAKAYVTAAMKAAYPMGQGKGPMNHLFGFRSGPRG